LKEKRSTIGLLEKKKSLHM